MADTTIAGLPLNETFADADVFERERDLSGTPGSVRGTFAGLVAWLKTKLTPASIGAMAVGAAPTAHAASHASGGSDAVTPALIGAARRTVATAVFTGATIALYDGFDQCIARISSASNAVSIKIEDTLEGGGSSDTFAFSCTLVVTDITNPITFATGAGLLTPVFMGTLKTITKVGTMIAIQVSNGVARVAIIEVAP